MVKVFYNYPNRNMVQRYRFTDIFRENPDGSLSPKRSIEVSGTIFEPGVFFQKGVYVSGIDFHEYKNWDLAVEPNGKTFRIKGFYKR